MSDDQPRTARQGGRKWPPYGELMDAVFRLTEENKHLTDENHCLRQELDSYRVDAGLWGGDKS